MPSNPTIATPPAYPLPDANNQIPSIAYLNSAIVGLLITGLSRDNATPGVSHMVSAGTERPSSPSVGEPHVNTTSGMLETWTGSEWQGVCHISSTAPTATKTLPWYDENFGVLRFYDILNGITGWHPTNTGYQLMNNRSGGQVLANRVVVRSNTADGIPEFTTTDTVKSQAVVGVLLEDTADTAAGLVATVQGGAIVDVLSDDGAADGAIVKGDALVTYSVAGECRTAGQLPSNVYNTFENRVTGTQLGAFAEALGSKDASTHLVKCRMLGHVGAGMHVSLSPTSVGSATNSTASSTSAYSQVDVSSAVLDTKHEPVVGAELLAEFELFAPGAAYKANSFAISLDASTVWRTFDASAYLTNNFHQKYYAFQVGPVDDASTTPAGPGPELSARVTLDASMTSGTVTFLVNGYTC